ncbi:hypothetical protein [Kitasatospora sp. NPDC093679]|uniref:GP88 family protein n=1 Tax=Kitasatospora sp. NPDC093679 TaxID=3154983 RepID=UPI003428223D
MDTPLSLPGMPAGAPPRPRLTQNSDLARHGIFNWTLPAWAGRLPDGRTYNTCPEADICARLCYAYAPGSSYKRFPNVAAAHLRNLMMVLDTPREWEQQMKHELRHRRYVGAWVRIHDSGDFFSDEYTEAWLRIARSAPATRFYCYTKAIARFHRIVVPNKPANFLWCPSLGGREDHLIDLTQRHADVFPTVEALEAAGYSDQSESDLLAVLGDPLVGIPANGMATLRKRQGPHSFGELQRKRRAQLTAKRARAAQRATAA